MKLNSEKKLSNEDFSKLVDSTFKDNKKYEKIIIAGNVVSVTKDNILIDVGLKSEGKIPMSEFSRLGTETEIKIGDKVDVYVDNLDDKNGEIRLSREKAIKQTSWNKLEKSFKNGEKIIGVPFNKVKGGLSVDLNGVTAFLPGSQIHNKPIKNTNELLNKPAEMIILKMDKIRGNIVVSRKAIIEEERKEAREELLSNIKEGSIIKGTIKNLTDYGAFIDLGGMDGLVHITDITWGRVNHPNEFLKIGDEIKVKVLKFEEEKKRLSLGIKQLTPDPWEKVAEKYKVDEKYIGTVASITDYGAFVKLDNNIEGLIHSNDLNWTKKNIHASKILSLNEEVTVKLLEIDNNKKRISLGLKQCKENPWEIIIKKHKVGDVIESSIVNIVDFGIFVKIYDEIDGMVHISDLSWGDDYEKILSTFTKGQNIKIKILEIDSEKERISLGIKQLTENPIEKLKKKYSKNSLVTCEITEITNDGLNVKLEDGNKGFISKLNLAKEKNEQKTERFAIGEKIDSVIISFDQKSNFINLSVKQKEINEEKEALNQYGSSDSGASLGDILGKVLKKKK
tara:strand:- start:207 stop:1901 length:1695 start_codon:yes stop_codon:yes gene_type:complete